MVKYVTSQELEKLLAGEKPVVCDFWASWCGPCRMLSPIVDSLAEETPSVKVCKVNVDEQPELAMQFGVQSIPMLVVMEKGAIVNKTVGVQPKENIKRLLGI